MRLVQRVLLWLLALVFLQLPAFAQHLLGPFEAALDDRRYTLAAQLVDRLPESPEKLLARAELGIVTGCAHTSYALADQIAPASLSPRLRAKYLLIRARQEEIATRHGPARESLERLLRDGLAPGLIPSISSG